MRKKIYYSLILYLFLAACQQQHLDKPILLGDTPNYYVPQDSIFFETKQKKWKAILLSFTQPIPLQISYNNKGLALNLEHTYGITEGPANIILSHNNENFIYNINLKNSATVAATTKDYRSPKTVNPDSSLIQHQIIHTIDTWRNIAIAGNGRFFEEKLITQSPIAGNFRAQKEKPISAFYIQAGSVANIPILATYNKIDNTFEVKAGPLKDTYGNTIANGTNVAFYYTQGGKNARIATVCMQGIATAKIIATNTPHSIFAKVNETVSATIQLSVR